MAPYKTHCKIRIKQRHLNFTLQFIHKQRVTVTNEFLKVLLGANNGKIKHFLGDLKTEFKEEIEYFEAKNIKGCAVVESGAVKSPLVKKKLALVVMINNEFIECMATRDIIEKIKCLLG